MIQALKRMIQEAIAQRGTMYVRTEIGWFVYEDYNRVAFDRVQANPDCQVNGHLRSFVPRRFWFV